MTSGSIADRTTPCEHESGIEPLAAAGVPIWIDARARIAHAKTMVIDSAVTLTGSVNWTRGAAVNSEDLNPISSPAVAASYAGHWSDRLAVSSPFKSARGLVSGGIGDIMAMADGRLRRLFWRVADDVDYLWTLARLRVLDALAGPLPETPADQQRARDRERIERAFPTIEP